MLFVLDEGVHPPYDSNGEPNTALGVVNRHNIHNLVTSLYECVVQVADILLSIGIVVILGNCNTIC